MFDLDGTLVRFYQDDFIGKYFNELGKIFIKLGLDANSAAKAVWAGSKAMVLNDGEELNTQRFWDAFSAVMNISGEQLKKVEEACDSFYTNEFNVVKSIVRHSEIPKRLVRAMISKGYHVVLATNPQFPPCAVESRLGWIELGWDDFKFITHYENSSFCKPNLAYYKEILSKIDKTPQECIMIGNNPVEDMCAAELGMETFLVIDFIENENNVDISQFRHGSIEDLEVYLMAFPDIK